MFRFRKATPSEKTVQPMPSGTPARKAIQVKVMRPERFADAPLIADELLSGRTVVIQPERMEREALRHLLDFISGVTYAVSEGVSTVFGLMLVGGGSIVIERGEIVFLGGTSNEGRNDHRYCQNDNC